jgi:hypothetical protein
MPVVGAQEAGAVQNQCVTKRYAAPTTTSAASTTKIANCERGTDRYRLLRQAPAQGLRERTPATRPARMAEDRRGERVAWDGALAITGLEFLD